MNETPDLKTIEEYYWNAMLTNQKHPRKLWRTCQLVLKNPIPLVKSFALLRQQASFESCWFASVIVWIIFQTSKTDIVIVQKSFMIVLKKSGKKQRKQSWNCVYKRYIVQAFSKVWQNPLAYRFVWQQC